MQLPTTIDEVLQALDQIVEASVAEDNYVGIFAYVYRRTTAEIKHRLDSGQFEDNPRMQEMDVVFANLYIKAYRDYQRGGPTPKAWKLCFDRASQRLTLIQHLVLGMNAHINMDLAIAASQTMQGKPIGELEDDFKLVNQILADITDELQERLGRVSPLLFLLDWIGQRSDEKIADFSITAAREFSWLTAVALWECSAELRNREIDEVDQVVTAIGERFASPRTKLLRGALALISRFESHDKARIIDVLRS